jgi:phage terminase large subunit GpA-like protein
MQKTLEARRTKRPRPEKPSSARGIRFSNSLEPVYYEQLASQRRVVKYSRGRAVSEYRDVSSRVRNEALDCLVYGTAARSAVMISYDHREKELRLGPQPRRSIASMLAH